MVLFFSPQGWRHHRHREGFAATVLGSNFVTGADGTVNVPVRAELFDGTLTVTWAGRPPHPPARRADAHRLVAPTLIQAGEGEREGQTPRSLKLHALLGTAVAGA